MTTFELATKPDYYLDRPYEIVVRTVDMLLLMAFRHGATRLEFRTISNEFRIAEIIDSRPFEFPSPPTAIRDTVFKYLRTMCSIEASAGEGNCNLKLGDSTAAIQCKFDGDQNVIVEVISIFSPTPDYEFVFDAFWNET